MTGKNIGLSKSMPDSYIKEHKMSTLQKSLTDNFKKTVFVLTFLMTKAIDADAFNVKTYVVFLCPVD